MFLLIIIFYVCLIFIAASGGRICVINSTNVVTLTAGLGVIANETQNVIVYCICTRNNQVAVGSIQWLFNSAPVNLIDDGSGNPYYRDNVPSPLIVPTFTATHVGMYSCTHVNLASDTIFLTLPGMCSFIVYCLSCIDDIRTT